MKKRKKLIDVFPEPITGGGIFNALATLGVPWDTNGIILDTEYFYNISGQKRISPLVHKLSQDEELTTAQVNQLASVILGMCGTNWAKLYNTLSLEYNPISNYDMEENETINGTDETTAHHTGTQQNASSSTESGTTTGSGEWGIYGFNSTESVGDSDDSTTSTNTATASGTDTRTDNLTDTSTGERETTRTLTRSGNIGVTTSQQMIQSERDLWLWNFFYNVVFPDVDKVLTIATYSND